MRCLRRSCLPIRLKRFTKLGNLAIIPDQKVFEEEAMLEIPPFTIEELKDLPFTVKAVEQLEQEATLKGLEKGLQKGSLKTKKDDIKSVILIKFGVLPKEVEEKIETTDDIQILDDMLKRVALAGKIEEIS